MGIQVVWKANHNLGFGNTGSEAYMFEQFNEQIQYELQLVRIVGGKNTIIGRHLCSGWPVLPGV